MLRLTPAGTLPPGLSVFRWNLNRAFCRTANLIMRPGAPVPNSDIADHLAQLTAECVSTKPRLIVELGSRGGMSTQALISAADQCGAKVLSVDIEDCSRISHHPRWHFVQSDDIAFAAKFPGWCKAHSLAPVIDFLFIDTSHLYEHTLQEISAWSPFVTGKIAFHDTNLRNIFRMKDGRFSYGWNNHRGVVQAIERWFDIRVDETEPFNLAVDGWRISHVPYCCGLTVASRA